MWQRSKIPHRFDGYFDETSKQNKVYRETTHKILTGFTEGQNGCIFAYGQTGTGKTYTLFGEGKDSSTKGITELALEQIFDSDILRENQCKLYFSMIELYNENIYDLLNESSLKK